MGKRQNLRYSLTAVLSEQLKPITAANLAKKLDVSLRTVKYCVSDINDLAGEKIIHSDKNGYSIVKNSTVKEKFRSAKTITSENERYYRLIKEVILEQRKISIIQLADIMMVSESLARKTIREMNSRAAEFDVRFYVSDGVICISGNEVKIRKLVSTIIFEETSQKFSLRESLEDIFEEISLIKVKDIIKQFTNKNNHRYNDYSIYNLTVHVLIIIERVRNGCFLPGANTSESDFKKYGSFIEKIEHELTIIFPEPEKKTIYLLLDAYFGVLNQRDINDEQIAENSEWFDLANDLAERTESHFMISLRSDTFISLFSAHLKSLSHRINENRKQYNTMKIDLRNNCKVIFDISIYIAFQLASVKGWILNEDEVSFIALHIGSELERQRERDKESSEKLSCAIFCPKYNELSQQVESQLVRDFAKRINVVINTSELNVLNKNHYDLVITTEIIELVHPCELIKIPPFGIEKYSLHIAQK
ncbi:BglG family transcription antiterminator (plasmid) [Klebsiella sp. B345]|uniref:BglG family transcription antiterminator n=1 Tax=Klebsiella sp. B345 TaxID=2755398 RepID=UPI003DA7F876